jgi:hypothetical protein
MKCLKRLRIIKDYVGPHNRGAFPKKMRALLAREFGDVSLSEVRAAARAAYAEYENTRLK